MRRFMILTSLAIGITAHVAGATSNPIEIGAVRWGRDLDAALERSAETHQPVLVLFQEVPGCAGCQKFGREVLTHPLLVEAIEDEFLPVVVYNNREGGEDQELLMRFQEPAWNYQVIRFLNADGRDIIPRKDRVWTIGGVASRMIEALNAAQRPVPKYLEAVAAENDQVNHGVAVFAMFCFWTGEFELGKIEGVVSTEAGWLDGREVTLVRYHKDQITLGALAEKAAQVRCAQKLYVPGDEAISLEGIPTGVFDAAQYRKAKASDQKKQIQQWKAIHEVPGLTAMQRTKINAMAPVDQVKALEWLSPRQREALVKAEEAASAER